jgi:16S rRNA processing protein RimM
MEPTAGSRSSTSDLEKARREPAAIVLGRVVDAHGLRGGIRVRYFAGDPEGLLGLASVALGRSESDPEPRRFEVLAVAPGRPGEVRMDLAGVRAREAALALRGLYLLAAPSDLPPLGPREYYGYQLLGCRVEGEDGTVVGSVRSIWETGASDLLEVEAEGGALHLIPAPLLRRVDVEARLVVVELLPGLLGEE